MGTVVGEFPLDLAEQVLEMKRANVSGFSQRIG